MINRNMDEAPRDRNILILTTVMHYCPRDGWYPDGEKWIEGRWRDAWGGRPAEFVVWCGNPRTFSTEALHPLAWAELPADNGPSHA